MAVKTYFLGLLVLGPPGVNCESNSNCIVVPMNLNTSIFHLIVRRTFFTLFYRCLKVSRAKSYISAVTSAMF